MSVRLLCVGDIHLGRQPSRVPADVAGYSPAGLGPAGAWSLVVEEAIDRAVDAVLLAGDVVEQDDDFYEAYGDLHAGVERLSGAGIAVIGVAGNHDVQVLPRLADAIPGFHLLGRGGRWEALAISARDSSVIDVVGWSFPEPRVSISPFLEPLPERPDGRLRIGLLHCDRDRTGSYHAPVRSTELAQAPVDAWLLGHIHRPDALDGNRPAGYLGSVVGLDPTETGAHGPWFVESDGAGGFAARQLALAPLRWERIDVPLDTLESAEDVRGLIVGALDALHDRIGEAGYRPRAIGCRVRLTGRTAHRRALQQELAASDPRDLRHERDGTQYFIDEVRVEARPAVDLEALAAGSDPAALLARRLLVLDRDPGDKERAALLRAARERFATLVERPEYAALRPSPPGDAECIELLRGAALRALDDLLVQREAAA